MPVNHPTALGSFDRGLHKCDCGSFLFVQLHRIMTDNTIAVEFREGQWIQCAHCRTIYQRGGYETPWMRVVAGDGINRER